MAKISKSIATSVEADFFVPENIIVCKSSTLNVAALTVINHQDQNTFGLAADIRGNTSQTGNHTINGNITANDVILSGADIAEDFSVLQTDEVIPGCVMIFNDKDSIELCKKKYDKKVAGVISGAGNYKPGLTLDKQNSEVGRMPVALIGKVFCFVDSKFGAVEIGDMLTTSSTVGHAMKAKNSSKSFGCVIGKALQPLREGKGLLPILVTLQ